MTKKESNPKDGIGSRKVGISCLSMPVLMECGLGMTEGSYNYGRHNYRDIGVRTSVYFDATMRHLAAWYEGEDIDPDSGLNHVTKAITSLMVLRDAMIRGKVNDDRPPKTLGFVRHLNKLASNLADRYPNPEAPFTHDTTEEFHYDT